jgi:hypothetical protein
MRFSVVFNNSNDSILFETVYNADLLTYFVDKANSKGYNLFSDHRRVDKGLLPLLGHCNAMVNKIDNVLCDLCNIKFPKTSTLLDCLDQRWLNQVHALWAKSQQRTIDIDELCWSPLAQRRLLGKMLHEKYPDTIRRVPLADALSKLGHIDAYEEVNMSVHRLESFLSKNIEFSCDAKWQVFNNPLHDCMVSNNDTVNFLFGYTYVGRQFYNKWQHFDTELEFDDHYNYEQLEWAFDINLARPQTVPYSKEFLAWCKLKGVAPITTQIPIANIVDLDKNLSYYRRMLYTNSQLGNQARLEIH